MPFGFGGYGGGSYRAPAPRRLTQEELLAELLGAQQPAPPPRPAPVTNVRDLQGPDRRQAQTESLWAGLAALGANVSGDRRGAMAGLGAIQDAQDRALGGANARQEAENEKRAAEAAQAQRRQQASALYGMFERVTEGEDPGSTFAQRAENAAKAGSMAELQKLDAEKPMRAAARAKGYNPDAYETGTRLQEELKAEIQRRNDEAALAGKVEEAKKLAEAKNAAELTGRQAQRDAGVLWQPPQYEPLSRVEAVEKIRAKYREGAGGGAAGAYGGKVYKQGERLVIAKPPDAAHPNAYVVPLDGQPRDVGNLRYFEADGISYVQNKDDPNAGAYEVRRHEVGSEGYPEGAAIPFGPKAPASGARSVDSRPAAKSPTPAPKPAAPAPRAKPAPTSVPRGKAGSPPAAPKAELQALLPTLPPKVRAAVAGDLASGMDPADILRELRADLGGG